MSTWKKRCVSSPHRLLATSPLPQDRSNRCLNTHTSYLPTRLSRLVVVPAALSNHNTQPHSHTLHTTRPTALLTPRVPMPVRHTIIQVLGLWLAVLGQAPRRPCVQRRYLCRSGARDAATASPGAGCFGESVRRPPAPALRIARRRRRLDSLGTGAAGTSHLNPPPTHTHTHTSTPPHTHTSTHTPPHTHTHLHTRRLYSMRTFHFRAPQAHRAIGAWDTDVVDLFAGLRPRLRISSSRTTGSSRT